MTNVLITVASRMGSTREIGETIAQQLRADGLSVDVRDCAQDPDPTHYRAVIIGSAIYFRRWLPDARGYLRRHRAHLRHRPVWLFQSGATAPDVSPRVPGSIRHWETVLQTRPPVAIFGGRLDRRHARGALARWASSSTQMCGDVRDWEFIRRWAASIPAELAEHTTTPPPTWAEAGPEHGTP